MDAIDANRFRHRKFPSSDRLLGVCLRSVRNSNSDVVSTGAGDGEELNEDDILWTGDFTEPNHPHPHHSNHPPPTTPSSRFLNHNSHGRPVNFGILAALPENEPRSVFNHKATASASSSSSSCSTPSRMIPVVPKPPIDRHGTMSVNYHQSAPVNIPVRPPVMRNTFDFDDDDDERNGEMLPPHEMAARGSEQSPMVACSVVEGAGRTLKGRDLRQVSRKNLWIRRHLKFLDVAFDISWDKQGVSLLRGFEEHYTHYNSLSTLGNETIQGCFVVEESCCGGAKKKEEKKKI